MLDLLPSFWASSLPGFIFRCYGRGVCRRVWLALNLTECMSEHLMSNNFLDSRRGDSLFDCAPVLDVIRIYSHFDLSTEG